MTETEIAEPHQANRKLLAIDIAQKLTGLAPDETGFTLAGLLGSPTIWESAWRSARPQRDKPPSIETRMAAIELLASFGDDPVTRL